MEEISKKTEMGVEVSESPTKNESNDEE